MTKYLKLKPIEITKYHKYNNMVILARDEYNKVYIGSDKIGKTYLETGKYIPTGIYYNELANCRAAGYNYSYVVDKIPIIYKSNITRKLCLKQYDVKSIGGEFIIELNIERMH